MDNERIGVRAATDPMFRAALIADPAGTLADLGMRVRDGVKVTVEESTPTELVLCLPPLLPADVELDEDAIAGVAGGTTPLAVFATIAVGDVGVSAAVATPLYATAGSVVGWGLSKL